MPCDLGKGTAGVPSSGGGCCCCCCCSKGSASVTGAVFGEAWRGLAGEVHLGGGGGSGLCRLPSEGGSWSLAPPPPRSRTGAMHAVANFSAVRPSASLLRTAVADASACMPRCRLSPLGRAICGSLRRGLGSMEVERTGGGHRCPIRYYIKYINNIKYFIWSSS